MVISTDGLVHILQSAEPEQLTDTLTDNQESLFAEDRPFAAYIRELLQQYGLTQSAIIEKAGFSMVYGYRLLSEERHTRQRDYILRFCFAAGFTLEEIQRLLKLYGMSPLYARIPRDAVLIAAVKPCSGNIDAVNRMLTMQNMAPLLASSEP